MLKQVSGALLALAFLPAYAPFDPAAAFGARESVEWVRLSPDGSKIVYAAPAQGQGSRLYTVDLATNRPQLTAAADGQRQRLDTCDWVSNARLVCTIYAAGSVDGRVLYQSNVVAMNIDGSNMRPLHQESHNRAYDTFYGGTVIDLLPAEDNAVLMTRYFVPEVNPSSRVVQRDEGYGVIRIDTGNLNTRRVENARQQAIGYISDGRGNVRIMAQRNVRGATGMEDSRIDFLYRPRGSREWRSLGRYDTQTRDGIYPVAVDSDLDVAYIFEKVDGRSALFRMALDGSGRKEQLLAHGSVDVDQLLRIGRNRRVIGVAYATEQRQAVIFDPELRELAQQLSRALPDLPLINFVDSSADESKLLIFAGSDRDPGRYYLYDKATRQLAEIMLARPELENVRLAEVRPVRYRAADGTMIPAYLTLPPGREARNLPAIVMPHGGPSARDEWGFDWLAQYFANRGFVVIQPNFRGSAGYGDAWYRENGFQGWRTAIGDVNDSARWLVSEGIADGSKLAIFGWSYGGYAALQANVLDPGLFRAAVAVAPVTDLRALIEDGREWSSWALLREFIGTGPHLREGSPAQNAATIRAPVLMFHGDLDRNVGIAQSTLMRNRLRDAGKQVELITFRGLDHYLEDSEARTNMLRRSDAFIRAALGM